MLAIRMQRTGRKGRANYRLIIQDSRKSPTSGNVVAQIGHYDPHTKTTKIDKDKAEFYLKNGAQPSDRVAGLLKSEGVKLPKWVKISQTQKKDTKHPEKLRKNRPAGTQVKEEPKSEPVATEEAPETVEESTQAPAEEKPETTIKETSEVEASTEENTESPDKEPSEKEETSLQEQPTEPEKKEATEEVPPETEIPKEDTTKETEPQENLVETKGEEKKTKKTPDSKEEPTTK